MANTLTPLMNKILARGLKSLRDRTLLPSLVNSDWSQETAKYGDTITVPLPAAKTAKAVTAATTPPTPTSTPLESVAITLDQWYYDDSYLTDKELQEVDASGTFLPMQLQESFNALAKQINSSIFALYKGVYGYAGTAGTTPFASAVTAGVDVMKTLNVQLAPETDRFLVLDPVAHANAAALAAFADAEKRGSSSTKTTGQLGMLYGMDWLYDPQVPTHTAGSITTGLATKAATAVAVGATSVVCTTAASTGACALVVGDVITFAGDSQTYTLTAAATQASAATDVTLSVSPPIKVAKTGGDAVTLKASHVVNLGFQRGAFAFAMRPHAQSTSRWGLGAEITTLTDPVTNLTMRMIVQRQHMQVAWFLDALWGVKMLRPELACRLAG